MQTLRSSRTHVTWLDNVVNVFSSFEVLADCDTQILVTDYYLQSVAVNLVISADDLTLVGFYPNECAFFRCEVLACLNW